MRFVLAALLVLATVASATCPTIANAPAGVTLEGMGQLYLPFHGYGGVDNFNASFSFCDLWVSPPMQHCSQQASYVAIAHPACDHNSWYTVLTPWHWADGEAHVSYTYSGSFIANVHVGCGHEALKLENVTGLSTGGNYNWSFYMSSKFVCSSSSRCDQWADCADCTTAPSGNCGYCANTNTCSQGTSTGPNIGTCPFSWSWIQSQCPARPTLTPAPTFTPQPSNCGQWSSCYSCTTAPTGNCGWCANSNTCSLGTANGPTTGSCISWDWLSSECPATPPPTTMAPDHCAGYTTCGTCTTAPSPYCGWCANTNTCSSGTANGPSSGSCVAWDWLQSECPAGEAKRPEPVGKPRGPYGSRARRH